MNGDQKTAKTQLQSSHAKGNAMTNEHEAHSRWLESLAIGDEVYVDHRDTTRPVKGVFALIAPLAYYAEEKPVPMDNEGDFWVMADGLERCVRRDVYPVVEASK